MAKPRMDLSAFVGKLLEEQDGDVLREGIRVLSQALMETEVAGLIGAERHERTTERAGVPQWLSDADLGHARWARSSWRFRRCGPGRIFRRCCSRVVGPSTRCSPSSRRRTCMASRRAKSTSWCGRSASTGSRSRRCRGSARSSTRRSTAFRTRPLTGEHRYVWLDATYHKVRVDGRVISQATVVAIGVTSEGERQVLGRRCRPLGRSRVLDGVSAGVGETRADAACGW